jgi:hypothetical protein
MENTENTNAETVHTPAPQPKWFHNAWFSRGTLLIAGLFFLLPFININCSGNKLASIRGIDMVIGSDLKPEAPKKDEATIKEDAAKALADSLATALSDSISKTTDSIGNTVDSLTVGLNTLSDSLGAGLKSLGDSIGKAFVGENNPFAMPTDLMGGKNKKIEPNAGAIASFAFILLALIFSFFKNRLLAIITGILSILSASALFFIQMQIQQEISKQMGPFNFIPITFEFTNFYWLCIMFTIIAGVFSFIRSSVKVS